MSEDLVRICSKRLMAIRNLFIIANALGVNACCVIKILGSSHVEDADDIVQISLINYGKQLLAG